MRIEIIAEFICTIVQRGDEFSTCISAALEV